MRVHDQESLQFCHINEPVGPDLAPFGHALLSPTICTVFAKNVFWTL